jgi:outer membrane protein TolC
MLPQMVAPRAEQIGFIVILMSLALPARAQTLSADDAVRQAARNNPGLRAALHDLAAAGHGVEAEEGALYPTLFAGVQGQVAERISGSSRGVSRNVNRSVGGNAGVRYTSPIGTQIEVGVEPNVSWQTTNVSAASTDSVTIGPSYSGEIYAHARQPLLQGAGTDGVLAPLRQAEWRQTQGEADRDDASSKLVLDVLDAYWELWFAQQSVAVQEEALALGTEQLAETKLRVDVLGTAPRTDLLRFAGELASIREALSQARTTRASNAIELGRLLGVTPARAQALTAAGAPPDAGASPLLEPLTQRALAGSSELRALEAQLAAARDRVDAAADDDQPKLDLLAQVSMGGLWLDDGLSGLALPGGRPALTALVGLELEIPLGPSRVAAVHARARSELRAAEARLEERRDAISAEIAALHVGLGASVEQVALAAESTKIAGELAEAERQRLQLGTTTTSEVVKAQQTARESELRRLRAIVSQALSRLRMDERAGLLLARYAAAFAAKGPS